MPYSYTDTLDERINVKMLNEDFFAESNVRHRENCELGETNDKSLAWGCSNHNDLGVTVDDDGLTLYTSYDQANDDTEKNEFLMVVANKEIRSSDKNVLYKSIFYFEITILSGVAFIGLVPFEFISNQQRLHQTEAVEGKYPILRDIYPGKMPNSIGLSSDGQMFVNGISSSQFKNVFSQGLYSQDTIGCGWLIQSDKVFFTKNGEFFFPDILNEASTSFPTSMVPTVALESGGSSIIGNFGEKTFELKDLSIHTIENATYERSLFTSKKKASKTSDSFCIDDKGPVERSCVIDKEAEEFNTAIQNSIKLSLSEKTENMTILNEDEIEEAKGYARDLRFLDSNHDPDVKSSMEEMVRTALQKVQYTIEYSGKIDADKVDIIQLLDLNEFLIDALNASKKKGKATCDYSAPSLTHDIYSDQNLQTHENEVLTFVQNKDIFNIICMLRGHTNDRLEAAKALMGIAKDEGLASDGESKLRGEIRSSGGMHSLLTLFQSSSENSEMKLATALTVAYLVPSFTDPTHCQGDLGFRVVECLRFLVTSPNLTPGVDIASHEVREVAGLALTHLWINVLQPYWSERIDWDANISLSKNDFCELFPLYTSQAYHPSAYRQLTGHSRRLKQRQDMMDMQEILETVVSLVVIVAESEINDALNGNRDCTVRDLKYNAAVTVESLCAVRLARPIAVREGILKVLVQWLRSENVELVRPAVNSLRDLTSLHDEYMAGWIHSQIVNEGTLPAIVRLAASDHRDIRLAVAHILSSLSVAPHTRAAIIENKGLSYLVQLVVYSAHDLPTNKIDEPLALASGKALLRIALGAANDSDIKVNVIKVILEGGALEPFVAMAKSKNKSEIRCLSAEAIHVISEDTSVGQWSRRKLCDARAAYACGSVLKRHTPLLYSMLQLSKSKDTESTSGDDDNFPLYELHYALHALANMLEPLSQQKGQALALVIKYGEQEFQQSPCHDYMVEACRQAAESGGLESLLWMASLPVAKNDSLQSNYCTKLDTNNILMQSYRSLASLCPLLLSCIQATKGRIKWAVHVLLALTGVLKRELQVNECDQVGRVIRELQVEALRGLSSFAEYEPLKELIIRECLPKLLQFKNDRSDLIELSQYAYQVCVALGFNEDEMDVQLAGNDPKLLADWFFLERSLLIQAMVREEVRMALYRAWNSSLTVLKQYDPLIRNNWKGKDSTMMSSKSQINDQSDYIDKLRDIFENLVDDRDSLTVRNLMLKQYANIYENTDELTESTKNNEDSCAVSADQGTSSFFPIKGYGIHSNNDVISPGYTKNIDEEERTSSSEISLQTHAHMGQFVVNDKDDTDEEERERIGMLGTHPYPLNDIIAEKNWILAHRKALDEFKSRSTCDGSLMEPKSLSIVQLPLRVQNLLNLYFPSPLIQNEVLPLDDLYQNASFNFRALTMPEKRYFSFRREGQILSRIYEKHVSSTDLDDVLWTLGFSNCKFAGEFAETLVQALYRCPVIQSLSFSCRRSTACKRDKSKGALNPSEEDDEEDDGSILLAYLAGSLPPWVTSLTFDNVLGKNSVLALVKILETMGQRSSGNYGPYLNRKQDENGHQTFDSPSQSQSYGGFHSLAIRNSPQLAGDALHPFFGLLGNIDSTMASRVAYLPLLSLRVLDLSGNNLGDLCSSFVLQIVHNETSRSSLERLDLSGNNINEGKAVLKVLSEYAKMHHLSKVSQSSGPHGKKWRSPLRVLDLSSNGLGCGSLGTNILSLLHDDVLPLNSLNLANNGLTWERNILCDTLMTNTKLINLNLSRNCFSNSFVDNLLHGLLTAESTNALKTFIILDENSPPINANQRASLDLYSSAVRTERIRRQREEKQKVSCASLEAKESKDNCEIVYETKSNSLDSCSTSHCATNVKREDAFFCASSSSFCESSSDLSSDVKSEVNVSSRERRVKNRSGTNQNMITVLFSAPLVWKDRQNMLRPIEMLDFELERELLWQCFKEASMDIELSFDNATTDRLQATMTKCCGCLHYSGHGNPNYLTFEDGKGGLHWLEVNQLKDLISNGVKGGGAPFKFVFVSACHSGLAGETFVNAGVPHVVCCQQESQLMDSAALAFTRAFYLALAIGRTVKDSFEIGRQAVAVAPSVPDSETEMRKFVLLPKNGKHDVPIVDADPIPEWPKPTESKSVRRNIYQRRNNENNIIDQTLPTPPQGFLGREVEMYMLLNNVLTKRFVSLVGITGVGRSSLAAALCHYINDRKSTLIAIETIFYIRARPSRNNDIYGSFISPLQKRLSDAGKAIPLPRGVDIDELCQSIFHALSKTKALIVFDRAEILEGSIEAQEFPLFLSSLFRETRNVRVLMTANKPLGLSSLRGVVEHTQKLGPLNFKSTVRLFAILCPHVHTGEERRRLLALLVPDDQFYTCYTDSNATKRTLIIFKILGNGIPSATFDIAYQMTKEEYDDLLKYAGQINNM